MFVFLFFLALRWKWMNCSIWMFPSFVQNYLRDSFLQINMICAEGVERSRWLAAVGHVEAGNVGQLISSGGVLEKLLYDLFPPQGLQELTLRIEDCLPENNKPVEFTANDFILSR